MILKYSMPTELYFGKGCINENKEAMIKLGSHALIVTGKSSSKKNGSLQAMTKALENQKVKYHIFDDVEENPSLETIEAAANLGRSLKVDFVIGIGGGSPLDAAKAIAVFIKNPHVNKYNIFNSSNLESLPVVAVPTTSGTGSEVTPYSIVTVHSEKTKKNLGQNIFPTIAYLDSTFTYQLPYDITVSTSVDAFTHLVESYLNCNASLLSDMLAEKGFQLFQDCFNYLVNNDLSEDFRDKVMLASTIAGMAIAQVGTSLPHGMGYALTYHKKIPHGLANGVLTIEYLKCFKDKSKINKMLNLLGLHNLQDLKEIFDSLFKVNTKLTEEEIKEFACNFAENKAKLKNHPEEVDILVIEEIYRKSLS